MDPYSFARKRVAAKIRKWKTGVITLTRVSEGVRDPDEPWVPVAKTETVFTLDARADGAQMYMPGETIQEDELKLIVSPKAVDQAGAAVDVEPQITDKITVDGKIFLIKSVEPVTAAGTPAKFLVTVGI